MAFQAQQALPRCPPSPIASPPPFLNLCPSSTLAFSPYFEPTRLRTFHLRYLPFIWPGMLFPKMFPWLIPAFYPVLCSNVNS